jgi:plasmid stabilization system protein ParE
VAPKTVAWTRTARQDLLNTLSYLALDAQAPSAAARLLDEIELAAASLREFPDRGRIVPELGPPLRELLVGSHRLVYRVRAEVEILRLLHGRQDFGRAWRRGPLG